MKDFTLRDIRLAFRQLGRDNTSGSARIAADAIKRIETIIRRTPRMRRDVRFFHFLAGQLVSAQPSMGVILNLAHGIDARAGHSTGRDMLAYLDDFQAAMEGHVRIIAQRTAALLKDRKTVMTYSASSTVLESLLAARTAGLRFRVVVPESRPMNEGRDMMIALSKAFVPVLYMTDAAAMSMLSAGNIDAVLIGGDALYRNGFVCKAGSRAIASLCRAGKVPLYGLCGTEKIVPRALSGRFVIADKPARELTDFKGRSAKVENRYFEIVPVRMFTGIVTDR